MKGRIGGQETSPTMTVDNNSRKNAAAEGTETGFVSTSRLRNQCDSSAKKEISQKEKRRRMKARYITEKSTRWPSNMGKTTHLMSSGTARTGVLEKSATGGIGMGK